MTKGEFGTYILPALEEFMQMTGEDSFARTLTLFIEFVADRSITLASFLYYLSTMRDESYSSSSIKWMWDNGPKDGARMSVREWINYFDKKADEWSSTK